MKRRRGVRLVHYCGFGKTRFSKSAEISQTGKKVEIEYIFTGSEIRWA